MEHRPLGRTGVSVSKLCPGTMMFGEWGTVEAQWAARDRHLRRFVCEQPPYSILVRGIEAEVLPTCARYGMGVISWSPLAGGWLSGRYRQDADQQAPFSAARRRLAERFDLSLPANQRKLEAAEALAQLAEEAGLSLIELAIAFVLNHPAVTAAIIGPRTMEQLQSQLPAADVVLDQALLDRIDELVPPGTTSTPPTAAGPTRPCSQPHDGARGSRAAAEAASDRPTKETRP
jgi:aryl-alcohol dehydrogenase-like predicted oxidoreductase